MKKVSLLIGLSLLFFVFCLGSFAGEKSSPPSPKVGGLTDFSPGKKVLLIAHRGGAALAPENTLAACKNVIKIGVDFIELDVWKSVDGHLVAIHDDTVDRTTNGTGKGDIFTLEELKELDAGSKFSPEFADEKIPTLKEALELVSDEEIHTGICIEIKQKGIARDVAELVADLEFMDKVEVITFYPEEIKMLRDLLPEVPTSFLARRGKRLPAEIVKQTLSIGANRLQLPAAEVDEGIVDLAHRRGLTFVTWSTNTPEEDTEKEWLRLIQVGVDGITTNHPDKLKQILSKYHLLYEYPSEEEEE